VDHAQPLPHHFPWRAVAVIVGGVALVELVALIAIALVQLAPQHSSGAAGSQAGSHGTTAAAAVHRQHVQAPVVRIPTVPLRPRSRVRVLVLNGNGVGGAAAGQAARLRSEGYEIGGATNAERHDYARSMVMFVPGWIKEARRLARDTGVRMVAPLDGLRPSQLKGSAVVLLLGK
jgi:LytR cell envelope-related transcriptional attenuator